MNSTPSGPRAPFVRGFTLVELMIAVVIVGILSAVAIPNYVRYVQRSRTAEAQVVLREAAHFMQRFYAANNRYDETVKGVDVALPASLGTVPPNSSGDAVLYNVAITNVDAVSFTLSATPRTGGSMEGSECASLTLTQNGVQGTTSKTKTATECWK